MSISGRSGHRLMRSRCRSTISTTCSRTLDCRTARPSRESERRGGDSLFEVEWVEVAAAGEAESRVVALGELDVDFEVERVASLGALEESPPVVVVGVPGFDDARAATGWALSLVQDWLADERFE